MEPYVPAVELEDLVIFTYTFNSLLILRKRSQAQHLHALRATSIADYSW